MHPEIWSKSRKVGEISAEFVARTCESRLGTNMHCLVESTAGSELFFSDCFDRLWNTANVVKRNIPQCALGFIVDGQPIYKNTTLFASSIALLDPFKGFKCTRKSYEP